MSRATLYCGDALAVLKTLPDESVQCVVTSPPYWGLRDYGMPGQGGIPNTHLGRGVPWEDTTGKRNSRSVWTIGTQSYAGAHFATFPEELARRCIVASSRPGDTVLDPFGGSGTVAQVATGNGRDSIYIDLNPKYLELARHRIGPMLCGVA
jgi:DNA modification methylase